MLGFIYLILAFCLGYVLCRLFWPELEKRTETSITGKPIRLSALFVSVPAWFVVGVLPMTWATYLLGYCFKAQERPLLYANAIVIPVVFMVTAIGFLQLYLRGRHRVAELKNQLKIKEIVFIGMTIGLALLLMFGTFHVRAGRINIGLSVFSDFAPHMGMIRSFSYGNNFPTQYPHFAGEDVKYHFMFQFLAGNLEFLGMRLDYAFNLPSIIGFVGASFLLYALAVRIVSRRGAGILAVLFFWFRSSDALFDFLKEVPKGSSVFEALTKNESFIGTTPNESWGLWNLNVYCNQRHLALGMCLLLLVIYMLVDTVALSVNRIRRELMDYEKGMLAEQKQPIFLEKLLFVLRRSLFCAEGWLPKHLVGAIALGLMLGLGAFFNGACVIACLTVLFLLAVISDRRLEYVIVAVLTTGLSVLQTNFFIDGSAVETKYFFGFLAENKSLFGTMDYISTLLGILPVIVLAAFLRCDGIRKWILFAFTAPFLLAFTMSLTPDVTVNHKYIMMSVMLVGIFAGDFLDWLWHRKGLCMKLASLGLVGVMTMTGLYDLTIVLKKNDVQQNRCISYSLEEDELTNWIRDNTDSKDIILSSYYALHPVVMGGGMLYYGWPYYAWSAGYDTDGRLVMANRILNAASSMELQALAKQENIRFIIVDDELRNNQDLSVNEELIAATYECVFEQGRTRIFDTKLVK